MPRCDLDAHFSQIDVLISEANAIVPPSSYKNTKFRADLAGLLVVAIAATYETCVKEILFEYADSKHNAFGAFARKNYQRLNSKIRVNDLTYYCELFEPSIRINFKSRLAIRKRNLLDRVGINIETSYEQILTWRHDFAHARIRNTTIEEAARTHSAGKRVLYVFDTVFT